MKKLILTCALALAATHGFAQNTTLTNEQMQQMQKARDMMNSPEYQQQMQRAMERMKQQGMDPSKMQMMMNPKVMEAGMGMSACIQKTPGQEGLNRVSTKAQEMEKQVQALCKLGKKDEANAMQKDLSMKMLADPDMKAIQACAEQFKDKLNDPSVAEFRKQIDALSAEKQKDACGG